MKIYKYNVRCKVIIEIFVKKTITLDEFVQGCKSDPNLLQLLCPSI